MPAELTAPPAIPAPRPITSIVVGTDFTPSATTGLATQVTVMLLTPALVMVPLLVVPLRTVLTGGTGRALIGVLKWTGLAEVAAAVGLFVGLWVA